MQQQKLTPSITQVGVFVEVRRPWGRHGRWSIWFLGDRISAHRTKWEALQVAENAVRNYIENKGIDAL